MAKNIAKFGFCLALCMIIYASFTFAQEVTVPETTQDAGLGVLVKPLIGTVIFGIVGLILLIIGYVVFNLMTPYNINQEIAENKNIAAGIVVAGMLVALALIIMRAISL